MWSMASSAPGLVAKVKAVASRGVLRLLDEQGYKSAVKRLKLGEGEAVVIRIEREADAKRYHRLKWYYGYIVKQCVEHTGYTVPETDAMFRALFLPHDVETISLMSDEQMAEFNRQCEIYAAETVGVAIHGPEEARTWAA